MLENKVALITGASSGIGYATSVALSKAGAHVAAGARRVDRLKDLKTQLGGSKGNDILTYPLDVTNKKNCDSFVEAAVRKWGTVDILVNNAGLMPLSFFKNNKFDEWEQMINVNLKGVIYCTSAVIPYMLQKNSGHIINMSSVAGRVVFAGGTVYCATKHAITAFSEGLRIEFSPRSRIRVTCIEPGVVSTELLETITDESMTRFVEASKKMESLQAHNIADAIMYALEAPPHVNVNEILLRPTQQVV
jgi:NADP-dependent 3-hydroxy acid dehydrogenase YdfG